MSTAKTYRRQVLVRIPTDVHHGARPAIVQAAREINSAFRHDEFQTGAAACNAAAQAISRCRYSACLVAASKVN